MASSSSTAAGQQVRSLFRTFVREQRRGSLQSRPVSTRRRDPLAIYVRQLLNDPSEDAKAVSQRRLDNITVLLRNARVHNELLARYNPVYGKSEQERIKATANRVGLDVPKDFAKATGQPQEGEEPIDAKYRS